MNPRSVILLGAAAGLALPALAFAPAQASTRAVLTGTVIDAAGHPVPGALVAYQDTDGHRDTTTTGADGVYRLRERAGYSAYLDIFNQTEYPVWTSGGFDFDVDAKSTVVRNVTITPATLPTLLYGQVTDARTGKPVARLHVTSCLHEEEACADTTTDRNGFYAFDEYGSDEPDWQLMGADYAAYDLTTDATSKFASVDYDEEDANGAGPGVTVLTGQQVRFDFTVPRAAIAGE